MRLAGRHPPQPYFVNDHIKTGYAWEEMSIDLQTHADLAIPPSGFPWNIVQVTSGG
jgi:hypothetical protein